MQELLTFVAKSLVEHPDQVEVTQTEGPEAIILELHVAEEDMGKVIGKQGRIAKAIRAVVKAATLKNSKPVLSRFSNSFQRDPRFRIPLYFRNRSKETAVPAEGSRTGRNLP